MLFLNKILNSKSLRFLVIFVLAFSVIITALGFEVNKFNITSQAKPLNIDPKLTNGPLVIQASEPFFVEIDNKTLFSTADNKTHKLDLSQIEGNKTFKMGYYKDLLVYQLKSDKVQEYKINRDTKAILANTKLPKYVNDPNTRIDITLDERESVYIIKEGENEIYSSISPNDNCTSSVKEKLRTLSCKIVIKDGKYTSNLSIIDQAGNISKLSNNTEVKLVEKGILECMENDAQNNGKMICKGNKNGFVSSDKFKDTINIVANVPIELPIPLENEKLNTGSIKYTDEHDISSVFDYKYNVDTNPYDASMWVERLDGNGAATYRVLAKANKDSDFEAYKTVYSHVINETTGVYKKSLLYTGVRSKIFSRSDLPKDQTVLVKSDTNAYTGCAYYCESVNYRINIHPNNNPERIISYNCEGGIISNTIIKCSRY